MRKLPRNTCLFCGLLCKRATAKYCSYKCRAQDFSKKGLSFGGPKTKIIPKKCSYCKQIFKPSHAHIKCCSKSCAGFLKRDDGDLDQWIEDAKNNTGPRNLSKTTRLKMSLAAKKRNQERQYTKGIGGIRKDIGHYVRSSWEANVARWLLYLNCDYHYEKDTFQLLDNNRIYHYTPDFQVYNRYIEVKGWWNAKSQLIKKLMTEQYPNIRISYIGEKEYKRIEKRYGKQIQNWEYKRRRQEGGW